MAIAIKTFDEMVDSILDRIVSADVGFDDISKGSVLRTIVEAIVAELDIQYYQLGYTYDSLFIDTATGEDLDNLVAILNIYRESATYCTTSVVFARSTPAPYDIPIQIGQIISSRDDINGNSYEFTTTEAKILATGETSVSVEVAASTAGEISIAPHQLCIMNSPILGIDTVDNASAIDGGSDEETDEALRYRAKLALNALGKSTNDALEGAILAITGVEQVTVLDMHRGAGTTDIIVKCSSNPPSTDLQNQINTIVAATKASGIDVTVSYPEIVTVDINVTITPVAGIDIGTIRNAIGNAIYDYTISLGVGDTMIIRQMESKVLSTVNSALDISTSAPASNTTCTTSQIIRAGVITINGEVWTHA